MAETATFDVARQLDPSTEEEPDPLDGAAVGETRRVRITDRFCLWGSVGVEPIIGSDRDHGSIQLVDVRVEGSPGDEELVIEWETDVTKQLPRYWDRPVTEHPRYVREQPVTRKRRLLNGLVELVAFLIPVGIVIGVGMFLTSIMDPIEIQIGGETTTFPVPIFEMGPVVGVVLFIAFVIWILPRLPGKVDRGGW